MSNCVVQNVNKNCQKIRALNVRIADNVEAIDDLADVVDILVDNQTTAINIGGGNELYVNGTNPQLEFRTLIAGPNISIVQNPDNLTIDTIPEINLWEQFTLGPTTYYRQNITDLGVGIVTNSFLFGTQTENSTDVPAATPRRIIFDTNGSFRAGVASGTQWDTVNRGVASTAFGSDNTASGAVSFVGGGTLNVAGGDASFIGGGNNAAGSPNITSAINCFIGAGQDNTASNSHAAVIAGIDNTAGGVCSIVGAGGSLNGGNNTLGLDSGILAGGGNRALGQESMIGAGAFNITNGLLSTNSEKSIVGAGRENAIGQSAPDSFAVNFTGPARHSGILAGQQNVISGDSSNGRSVNQCGILAGSRNGIGANTTSFPPAVGASGTVDTSTICGGDNNAIFNNDIDIEQSCIGAGEINVVTSSKSFIGAGNANVTNAERSFIGAGGSPNQVVGTGNITNGIASGIVSGEANRADGERSFVGAGGGVGIGNSANTNNSGIVCGNSNTTNGIDSFIGGGNNNSNNGDNGFIGGGNNNIVNNTDGAIAGGNNNTAGTEGFVGGGNNNTATPSRSGILAGQNNTCGRFDSVVVGGTDNTSDGLTSGIFCGTTNLIEMPAAGFNTSASAIISGVSNIIGSATQTGIVANNCILSGNNNRITLVGDVGCFDSTILSGDNNTIGSSGFIVGDSSILCGSGNIIRNDAASVTNSSIIAGNTLTLEQNNTSMTQHFRHTGGVQRQAISFVNNIGINLNISNYIVFASNNSTVSLPNVATAITGQDYYVKTVTAAGNTTVNVQDGSNINDNTGTAVPNVMLGPGITGHFFFDGTIWQQLQ